MQVNLLYRPSQTVAQCWLESDEGVRAESGAMMGMSSNVDIHTESGGLMKGLKRLFGGESFFRNTFTAHQGRGEVLLTTPLCGDMTILEIGERQYNIQRTAYVGSSLGVDIEMETGGVKGWLSGAGFFMLATRGQGQMIVGAFGALERLEVDGTMVIDTGHLVAWDAALHYTIGKSSKSGWIASWLSGEGLVCHFEGRGEVWVQTRNALEYGRTVGAMLPPRAG